MRITPFLLLLITASLAVCNLPPKSLAQNTMSPDERHLQAIEDEKAGTISIYWENGSEPILVQNAWQKVRPYIHPVLAPDGNGVLTEYRPGHHTHQTGLYWGLKEVNGRDYFMECCKPDESGYYQKISSSILVKSGLWLKWQTVYDLLDENGSTILTETQTWVMKEQDGMYVIDLHWRGDANTDITVGEFFVGGLFLRMPWYPGITAEVVNAVGQRNGEAEAQRSMWVDVGMQVDGRDDMAHIAIFDHPVNPAFPVPWRVDNELGVGPSRQILGDWKLDEGQTEEFRYRLIVYTGDFDSTELTRLWTEYIIEECPDYF